ncbi:MAG: hypothetical protein ACYSU3_08450 [Planctomycetota bacterium]
MRTDGLFPRIADHGSEGSEQTGRTAGLPAKGREPDCRRGRAPASFAGSLAHRGSESGFSRRFGLGRCGVVADGGSCIDAAAGGRGAGGLPGQFSFPAGGGQIARRLRGIRGCLRGPCPSDHLPCGAREAEGREQAAR